MMPDYRITLTIDNPHGGNDTRKTFRVTTPTLEEAWQRAQILHAEYEASTVNVEPIGTEED